MGKLQKDTKMRTFSLILALITIVFSGCYTIERSYPHLEEMEMYPVEDTTPEPTNTVNVPKQDTVPHATETAVTCKVTKRFTTGKKYNFPLVASNNKTTMAVFYSDKGHQEQALFNHDGSLIHLDKTFLAEKTPWGNNKHTIVNLKGTLDNQYMANMYNTFAQINGDGNITAFTPEKCPSPAPVCGDLSMDQKGNFYMIRLMTQQVTKVDMKTLALKKLGQINYKTPKGTYGISHSSTAAIDANGQFYTATYAYMEGNKSHVSVTTYNPQTNYQHTEIIKAWTKKSKKGLDGYIVSIKNAGDKVVVLWHDYLQKGSFLTFVDKTGKKGQTIRLKYNQTRFIKPLGKAGWLTMTEKSGSMVAMILDQQFRYTSEIMIEKKLTPSMDPDYYSIYEMAITPNGHNAVFASNPGQLVFVSCK